MKETKIESALLINGRLEIVKRTKSNLMYATFPPHPAADHVFKEIYEAVDGDVKLVQTVVGKHQPGYYQDEKIEFPTS
jgi:hypothetical protein